MYWNPPLWPLIDNPLLIQALLGLPLLLLRAILPLNHPFWGERFAALALSSDFLWVTNDNGMQLLWAGRLVVIALSLFLALLAYAWGRQLGGRPAGLAALFLLTFDPNILAHSPLATTDIGTTLFVLLAASLLWHYWQRRTAGHYLLAGLGLGLALSTKFSAVALFPALTLMALYLAWRDRPGLRAVVRTALEVGGWLALAIAVLLLVQQFNLSVLATNLEAVRGAGTAGHPAYLLGEVRVGGWWYYFPVIFLAKTPLPILFLLLLAAVVAWRAVGRSGLRRFVQQNEPLLWLLLVALAWFAMAMASRINVGYRHLLPILLPLYLLMAQLARPSVWQSRPLRWSAIPAAIALAIVSLTLHPHYLAFFNLAAGGPAGGWRIAVDSNLDWGQDVQALADFARQNDITAMHTALFTNTPPQVYGVPAAPIPVWPAPQPDPLLATYYAPRPAAGWYAISATHLQGVFLDDPTMFAYFREQEPTARVGYSIFVYEVPADGPPTALTFSGVGLPDITPQAYEATVNTNHTTSRWYDAQTSLALPPAETQWAFIGTGHLPNHPLLQSLYPPPAFSGEHTRPDGTTIQYNAYHWQQSPLASLNPAPPTSTATFYDPSLPQEAILTFLGHSPQLPTAAHPGQSLDLLTLWQIEHPPAGPLQLFLHLTNPAGELVAQDDRWGVHPESLTAGDTVAQLHTVALPPDLPAGTYTLWLGTYNPETGQRFTAIVDGQPATDSRILLGQITVQDEE